MPIVSQFDAETPIGQIAARLPITVATLQRHRLDFCCAGALPLTEACAKAGADVNAVLHDLDQVVSGPATTPEVDWTTAPLGELVDHIVTTYHAPMADELERLLGMAAKVHRVHGDKDPARLRGVLETVLSLQDELLPHLQKEERILFPWIQQGMGAQAGAPIRVMHAEHEAAGTLLATLRRLTDDYTPPKGACTTWRALWFGLKQFEADLMDHIHLENNILFPRALAS